MKRKTGIRLCTEQMCSAARIKGCACVMQCRRALQRAADELVRFADTAKQKLNVKKTKVLRLELDTLHVDSTFVAIFFRIIFM